MAVSDTFSIEYKVFAHRNLSNLIVVEVDLVRTEAETLLSFKVELNRWAPSYDFTFLTDDSGMKEVRSALRHLS